MSGKVLPLILQNTMILYFEICRRLSDESNLKDS